MSLKTFFSSVFLVLVLFSCAEDRETKFSSTNVTTSNNKLVEINIPKAIGNDEIAKNINTEINKVVSASLHIGEGTPNSETSIEENIENFNSEYNSFATDFPESTFPWEAQIDGEVMFQSPAIISISITSYLNTGGAHGNVHILFLNFDAGTGKRLENESLFIGQNDFETVAKTYFEESIEDKSILFDPENFQLAKNIGFSEDGLILLYNTYEIAPYSAGIIEYTIPAEELNSLLAINSPY
ncbi:DUF3298 and DUF4163 domain-containing protein [Aestuariibaculum sp. YM273]|uniref:DUF3298 and DUF4163 domain-containing protein n=1 Tax=Aestuariibaculum sp. YM273 TaxID=3070659 RepID=UPI0027DBCC7B|nr:DUF3298 and DUF4163 domain-containing protein [Aestuariibaculum sp. YM273]WMI66519.1 DUF3298 and DUF4163 domain-containing protein [Aestuariibaculum sp. YM273]